MDIKYVIQGSLGSNLPPMFLHLHLMCYPLSFIRIHLRYIHSNLLKTTLFYILNYY